MFELLFITGYGINFWQQLSLSLSLSHTHTHTRAHTHMHTHSDLNFVVPDPSGLLFPFGWLANIECARFLLTCRRHVIPGLLWVQIATLFRTTCNFVRVSHFFSRVYLFSLFVFSLSFYAVITTDKGSSDIDCSVRSVYQSWVTEKR